MTETSKQPPAPAPSLLFSAGESTLLSSSSRPHPHPHVHPRSHSHSHQQSPLRPPHQQRRLSSASSGTMNTTATTTTRPISIQAIKGGSSMVLPTSYKSSGGAFSRQRSSTSSSSSSSLFSPSSLQTSRFVVQAKLQFSRLERKIRHWGITADHNNGYYDRNHFDNNNSNHRSFQWILLILMLLIIVLLLQFLVFSFRFLRLDSYSRQSSLKDIHNMNRLVGNNGPLGPKMGETIKALSTLQYMTPNGIQIKLDKEKLFSGVRRARLYQGTRIRRQIMDSQEDPEVVVVNTDCLDEALKLKKEGYKPIVLTMANREFPGGDYRQDGETQEAGLFLRSNLYQCLDTEPRRSEFYPLPSQGAAYCPNMAVVRKSEKEGSEFMVRPDWMSFLAMAPLRNPPLVPNEFNELIYGERAAIIMKKKIQAMFRIAIDNGHDAIVLSAFGCGRLSNPPESVAEIFDEIISTNFMGGAKKGRTFRKIVFAIMDQKPLEINGSGYKQLASLEKPEKVPIAREPVGRESKESGDDEGNNDESTNSDADDDDDDDDDGDVNGKEGEEATTDSFDYEQALTFVREFDPKRNYHAFKYILLDRKVELAAAALAAEEAAKEEAAAALTRTAIENAAVTAEAERFLLTGERDQRPDDDEE